MNGIDTILRRLDTDAKAEADAVLKKARQEAADITARYQAQAAQEAARLAARNEKAAEEREERLVSAAQMEGRKTILAAKQTVMEQVYDKALEKLLSLPRTQYIEVLAALLAQAALFAPVLLQCLACALAFAAAGILAGATGQRQCAQLCRLYFEGARLCGSMLVLYFFMIFLSTALLLLAGNGGLG